MNPGRFEFVITEGMGFYLRLASGSTILNFIDWHMVDDAHGMLGGRFGWHDEIVAWYLDALDCEVLDVRRIKHQAKTTDAVSYYRVSVEKR